jgi:small-conductance mechanosensitive channel
VHPTLALLASLGTFALLVALVAWLQRKFFLVRQLAFPLYVGAAAAAVEVYSLLAPPDAGMSDGARAWILLFLGAVTVLRLLGLYFFDIHLRARTGFQLPPLLPAVTMFVVYLIAAFVTLRVVFPKLELGGLIATSAVTSLVLGLALQPILSNFFAGLVISIERPFRINDWIKVGDHEGRVAAITWRTTHLRTRENDNLVIPNSKLADERVVNFYYPHPMHLERIKVGASYDVPPYRVRRALLEAIAGVPGVLDKPTPEVYLPRFDDSSIGYELRVWMDDVAGAPRIASEVRGRIWEVFRKEGITMPFPIRTLEIARRPRPKEATSTARLFVTEGIERGHSIDLEEEPVIVGRSRNCTLVLTEPNASKEHLRIALEDGKWVVTDLESSFGTKINGRPACRAELSPFDRITIGDTVIIFETGV